MTTKEYEKSLRDKIDNYKLSFGKFEDLKKEEQYKYEDKTAFISKLRSILRYFDLSYSVFFYKDFNDELKDPDFLKLCLGGDYYYKLYLLEISKALSFIDELIKKSIYNKTKNNIDKDEIEFYKENLTNKLSYLKVDLRPKNKPTFKWMILGELLASGKLEEIYNENERSATKTARKIKSEYGIKAKIRPYISDTFPGNNRHDNKNLYDFKRMTKTVIYCQDNGLKITPNYLKKYEKIKSEKG